MLIVSDYNNGKGRFVANHELIHSLNGRKFRYNQVAYKSLTELVETVKKNAKLTNVCIVARSPPPRSFGVPDPLDTTVKEIQFEADEPFQTQYPGFLFKGRWRGVVDVTVKVLAPLGQAGISQAKIMALKGEVELMKSLSHPNIVQIFAFNEAVPNFHLVTEAFENGPLDDYLRREGRKNVKSDTFCSIANDVIRALKYLKVKDIVHGQIAGRNVFLNEYLTAKVGNFVRGVRNKGRRRFLELRKDYAALAWAAVEVIRGEPTTFESDVWSFGVLLWEMATFGDVPFRGWNRDQVLGQLLEHGQGLRRPDELQEMGLCIDKVYELMRQCWRLEPEERPNIEDIAIDVKWFNEPIYSK